MSGISWLVQFFIHLLRGTKILLRHTLWPWSYKVCMTGLHRLYLRFLPTEWCLMYQRCRNMSCFSLSLDTRIGSEHFRTFTFIQIAHKRKLLPIEQGWKNTICIESPNIGDRELEGLLRKPVIKSEAATWQKQCVDHVHYTDPKTGLYNTLPIWN